MTKIQLRREYPEALRTVDEYKGEEVLNIYTEKTPQLKPWIVLLKDNKQIKRLRMAWNISQECFEAICELENLEELVLNRCSSLKNIDSIAKLKKLSCLILGDPTKIESVEPIHSLTNLDDLRIQNAKKVSHFDALSELIKLKVLHIDGSMWTAQPIDNFNFMTKLVNLRHLTFINTKAKKKNFDQLLNIKNLSVFYCSYNYPIEEFEKMKIYDLVAGNSHCLKNPPLAISYNEIVEFFKNEK